MRRLVVFGLVVLVCLTSVSIGDAQNKNRTKRRSTYEVYNSKPLRRPHPDGPHRLVGYASFYTHKQGGATAHPKYGKYDRHAFAAAHFSIPGGSIVRVTRTDKKDKSIVVVINDRGPFHVTKNRGRISRVDVSRPHQTFVIDLTPAGAEALGFSIKEGFVPVALHILGHTDHKDQVVWTGGEDG